MISKSTRSNILHRRNIAINIESVVLHVLFNIYDMLYGRLHRANVIVRFPDRKNFPNPPSILCNRQRVVKSIINR